MKTTNRHLLSTKQTSLR